MQKESWFKNLELYNLSLLGRRHQRILEKKEGPWLEVFKEKYDLKISLNPILYCKFVLLRLGGRTYVVLGYCRGLDEDLFTNAVRKKNGNGQFVLFWKDIWIGNCSSLKDLFPIVYCFEKVEFSNFTYGIMGYKRM